MQPRVLQPIYLLSLLAMALGGTSARAKDEVPVLEEVGVSGYQGDEGQGLRLSFKRLKPNPALGVWREEEAREVVEALEEEFQQASRRKKEKPRPTTMLALAGHVPAEEARPSVLERRVREEYEELLGPAQVQLPGTLESARWFQALRLSPRYMGEGVREAALELFSSPAVLLSVGTSMMLYMLAWAVPEPVFSKALAGAVTVGLLLTYSAAELYNVGQACLRLYREAEAARTREELEAVAERFGKALGGVGLRVLVTVAGAKLARGLPEVPKGGLWAGLSPPRFAMAGGGTRGGVRVVAGTRAQVSVADGTVVLMGVTANTATAAVASAVSAARTTGACTESKQDGHHRHHLCTNKNDTSEITGGPWTPRFETLFETAGMSLDDPANIVYLRDHKGPHPEAYHREVFNRLEDALSGCRPGADCRAKLVRALDEIAGDICKPGSTLNKLATRKS
ncbi:AHH domain-containing protein [Archangium lansingense]|uniref:AHH domain-containing protein n=1 Tax=Archangium lansingense TaxID=2995310 RepID=A0ABT4AGE2_9BACT|nr:AHH domain-containing protein [Archangium lansinium]MCY1080710.1 AHH domain-containing protein [Archangium lansinium]